MSILHEKLGKAMTVEEVAEYLSLDHKTVRKYFRELGGVRVGRAYRFFEMEVIHALQTRKGLDGSNPAQREKAQKDFSHQIGSNRLGGESKGKHTAPAFTEKDSHGIFR